MGEVVKFKQVSDKNAHKYSLINKLNEVKQQISREQVETLCVVTVSKGGVVGFGYSGTRLKDIVIGLETAKVNILKDLEVI